MQKNDEFLTMFSTHASTKTQKYLFFHKPLSEFNFFVILMSTYYNKSNLKVRESSEQYMIEMSILNGVSVQFCFFLLKYKNGSWPLQNKILVDFEKWGKD